MPQFSDAQIAEVFQYELERYGDERKFERARAWKLVCYFQTLVYMHMFAQARYVNFARRLDDTKHQLFISQEITDLKVLSNEMESSIPEY